MLQLKSDMIKDTWYDAADKVIDAAVTQTVYSALPPFFVISDFFLMKNDMRVPPTTIANTLTMIATVKCCYLPHLIIRILVM